MAKSTSKKSSAKKTPPKKTGEPAVGGIVADNPGSAFIAGKDLSLEDLFLGELKDMYWAEGHLVKSLPKMIAAAGSADLQQALADHLEVTRTHVARIEQALEILGEKVVAKKCDAMEGLTMGGEHVIENTMAGTAVRDTGIIMSGLKVENFEITCYKGLVQVAQQLKQQEIAELLQASLDEEQEAADLLESLSMETVSENA